MRHPSGARSRRCCPRSPRAGKPPVRVFDGNNHRMDRIDFPVSLDEGLRPKHFAGPPGFRVCCSDPVFFIVDVRVPEGRTGTTPEHELSLDCRHMCSLRRPISDTINRRRLRDWLSRPQLYLWAASPIIWRLLHFMFRTRTVSTVETIE